MNNLVKKGDGSKTLKSAFYLNSDTADNVIDVGGENKNATIIWAASSHAGYSNSVTISASNDNSTFTTIDSKSWTGQSGVTYRTDSNSLYNQQYRYYKYYIPYKSGGMYRNFIVVIWEE